MTVPPVPTPRSQQRQKVLDLMKKPKSQSKYRAVRCEVDGEKFDSKAEARRWGYLLTLSRAGQIWDLQRQPIYWLKVNGVDIGRYIADFRYTTTRYQIGPNSGGCWNETVIEDVKGTITPLAKWKLKHVKAQYGIDVQIVKQP